MFLLDLFEDIENNEVYLHFFFFFAKSHINKCKYAHMKASLPLFICKIKKHSEPLENSKSLKTKKNLELI